MGSISIWDWSVMFPGAKNRFRLSGGFCWQIFLFQISSVAFSKLFIVEIAFKNSTFPKKSCLQTLLIEDTRWAILKVKIVVTKFVLSISITRYINTYNAKSKYSLKHVWKLDQKYQRGAKNFSPIATIVTSFKWWQKSSMSWTRSINWKKSRVK